MINTTLRVLFILGVSTLAMANEGMVQVQSNYSVEETATRMEAVLKQKGMTVFGRVNHSDAAHDVDIELRDTVLLMFGNPKVGSLLMQCQQSVAIDLPLKVLIWQDEQDMVWISYNRSSYLKNRHQIEGCEEVLSNMEKGLDSIVQLSRS